MAKKKIQKTNAIRLVEQKKIPYEEHTYSWTEDDLGAEHVAEQIAISPEKIFKTLVLLNNKNEPLVAVIPSDHELDLKKLAKASNNKKVEMLHLKDLEKTTGYIRGGCSPVGMKKLFPTYIDQTAKEHEQIVVSAGKRGLQMELAAEDILRLTNGHFADLID